MVGIDPIFFWLPIALLCGFVLPTVLGYLYGTQYEYTGFDPLEVIDDG